MFYLASRYTSNRPEEMEERFRAAERATAAMLSRREFVYSPIVHCHQLAHNYALPKDFAFWRDYNFSILRHAQRLIVLNEFHVELSIGVGEEVAFAKMAGIPITYADLAALLLETPK